MPRAALQTGLEPQLLPPQELAGVLDAGKTDILVICGPAYVQGDLPRIIHHLQRGDGLWLMGTQDMFSCRMVLTTNGQWQTVENAPAPPPELARILDAHWPTLALR